MHELVDKLKQYLEAKQLLLAGTRGAWLLAVLGLVSGLVVGVVVILFRLFIEMAQSSFLPAADPENTEIPSKRQEMLPIRQQSTLQQALSTLNESEAEALYVIRPFGDNVDRIHGIVTREAIEKSYRVSSSRRS
jgi:hypothetical protein